LGGILCAGEEIALFFGVIALHVWKKLRLRIELWPSEIFKEMAMSSDLLRPDGSPAFGLYTGEIKNLDLSPYKLPGLWNTSILKPLRAKRWRFVGLFSEEIVCGMAVVDAGYVGTAFAYAFDMKEKRIHEFKAQSPLGRAVCMADSAVCGEAVFEKGNNRIGLYYGLGNNNSSKVEVDVKLASGRLIIEADFAETDANAVPHQLISPTPGGSFAFTHKTAGIPATATVSYPGRTIKLDSGNTFAGIDHTAGYHDYHWVWYWSAMGGIAENGQRIGLNLVSPVHHPTFTENAIWVDGKRYPVGQARYTFDKNNILKPWTVKTIDDMVELEFTPYGERWENFSAGIFNSRFHQPVGKYKGLFRVEGKEIRFSNVSGVCEDHEAHW